ncbi:MAG: hypothetical protein HY543_08055 [Deltaproteobacteria bacterium]|nr:hypothetical protein [Deltaproteobacteria bacterium]
MRVLIIEPSVLARNVFRLLLRRLGDFAVEEFARIDDVPVGDVARAPYGLLLLGGHAFDRGGGMLRTLCTDVAAWQQIPKLIIAVPHGGSAPAPWSHLARSHVLTRPFTPAAFGTAVQQLVKDS